MIDPYELKTVVRREALPDPSYFFESVTVGMRVTLTVKEMRGRTEVTREMFTVQKTKHNWTVLVETFKQLAKDKYSAPVNSMANLYKSGS